jgi:hypothetical protein
MFDRAILNGQNRCRYEEPVHVLVVLFMVRYDEQGSWAGTQLETRRSL